SREHVPAALVERFVSPPSRVAFAQALAPLGAVRAAIDVSDGLVADLAHLTEASGVGAVLAADALPADDALREAARRLSAFAGQERGPLPAGEAGFLRHLVTGPSDDYELLLALDPARVEEVRAIATAHGVPLHVIGRLVAGSGVALDGGRGPEPLVARGWDHFAS
ncbi:MAG: thiamine-phosphate kinase, partial [bacterium]